MNIDPTKVGTVAPYRPVCEVCGEENEPLATELRKAKLVNGGRDAMAVLMPLRPLSMCDRCREALALMVRHLMLGDLSPNGEALVPVAEGG